MAILYWKRIQWIAVSDELMHNGRRSNLKDIEKSNDYCAYHSTKVIYCRTSILLKSHILSVSNDDVERTRSSFDLKYHECTAH